MGFLTSRPAEGGDGSRSNAIGIHLFGRCDHIAGLGYVATDFVHAGPLLFFPVGSSFVLDGGTGVVPLPSISLKSVLVAYVRAAWLFALPLCAVFSFMRLIQLEGPPPGPLDLLLQPWAYVALGSVVAAAASFPLARATAARRRALIAYLGREPHP